MADWDTILDARTAIPNGHVASKVDPSGQGLPGAYTNPAFRHNVSPIRVSPDRFSSEKHLMENHLVYDNQKNSFLDDTEKISKRQNGSIAVRRVYKDTHAKKYATTRLPNESVALNPMTLPTPWERPPLRKNNTKVKAPFTTHRHSAPVYRSRSKSPRLNIFSDGIHRGSDTFKRIHGGDRKEDFISFFDIETDKVERYQYRPGEEVAGAIKIIVKQNFEIRYVELVVTGQAHLTIRSVKDGLPKTIKETYLRKQTYVIGNNDSAWTSVLTAGNYTSKFRIKLPADLPSSIHHDDANNGFSYDVKYTMMARICDDVTRASVRSTTSNQSTQGLVRVILAKKTTFQVQRGFDIHTIQNALDPVIHKEQVWLSCAHQYPAIVSVQLDRSVFLAGDDIRMQLAASLPRSQRIKDITCSLQEHVSADPNSDPVTFTLSQMICKDPDLRGHKNSPSSAKEENTYDVTIPTNTDLISSFSVPKAKFKVTYSLEVILKFSPSGGKLSFMVPIGIGPCAEPIYAEKISSRKFVPLFNRATRFPCFSPSPPKGESTPRQTSALSGSTTSIPVTTKYTNSFWSRCFLCCTASTGGD